MRLDEARPCWFGSNISNSVTGIDERNKNLTQERARAPERGASQLSKIRTRRLSRYIKTTDLRDGYNTNRPAIK